MADNMKYPTLITRVPMQKSYDDGDDDDDIIITVIIIIIIIIIVVPMQKVK
jgi:hypothetical protein